MTPQSVKNIVISCENEDTSSLIGGVDSALTEKVIDAYEKKKKKVSKSLFEAKELLLEPKKNKDPYEEYDPKIKEAIDYTIENVMEGGLELENTLCMAATQYNVKEETLREYFDALLETTRDEIRVDSTSSNDEDEKRGTRDDEDTNKRVRYEHVLNLKDGTQMILQESLVEKIDKVMLQLNEENLTLFVSTLTLDKPHFFKTIEFCQKMVK